MSASSKALGTYSPIHGINVIPVSMITIVNDSIVLFNYYMKKTLENIQSNDKVSLSCWSDRKGLQIKATAEYKTANVLFDDFKMENNHDEIPFHGILILTVTHVYHTSTPTI